MGILAFMVWGGQAQMGWAGGNCLEIRNGYFWDPAANSYFIPHGVAYQVWNPPVYAVQTTNQVAYDLHEMKRMHVNSLRVEFTWSQVETNANAYDFSKIDSLIEMAERLDMKLFVLMGYQYPPAWFKAAHPNWMGWHYDQYINQTNISDVLNYNCPEAEAAYASYVNALCARYKDKKCIGGWIVGNEFAYYDLWEPPDQYPDHRFLGFDTTYSLPSYRNFLTNKYQGSIANLNSNWGTAYGSFNQVVMANRYPTNHQDSLATQQSGYYDLIQWRKQTIGEFLSAGVAAARAGDTNHLVTYAMVGGIFSGTDDNNGCEDARAIVTICNANNTPVDFWTINNYPWTWTGSEMRSMDFGVTKYREFLGLPVMLSECGLSDNDTIFPETVYRQRYALASLPWEAIMSGAMGAHIFHWNDRNPFFAYNNVLKREGGFGFIHDSRLVKDVYWSILDAYRKMDELHIERVLPGSMDPPEDVLAYWGVDADLGFDRANQEMAMIWGAFKRMGYQIGIINEEQFEAKAYTNAAALFVSRCFAMPPSHLDALETQVLATGIHVHANADFPGQFDAYYRSNQNWIARMDSIFGLNVTKAEPGFESGIYYRQYDDYRRVYITNLVATGLFSNNFSIKTWKVWHGVTNSSGVTLATQAGVSNSQPAMPVLTLKSHPNAKAMINTIAIGDTMADGDDSPQWEHPWDVRTKFIDAIYRQSFGITPKIQLTGEPFVRYVISDYRVCSNGSVLISLMNMSSRDHSVSNLTLTAPTLLNGRKIENLTRGGVITNQAGNSIKVDVLGDEFVLLYAYASDGTSDASLINTNIGKIWFLHDQDSAPSRVYARPGWEAVHVGYDIPATLDWENIKIGFERKNGGARIRYGTSADNWVAPGTGSLWIAFPVPDADLGDPAYASTPDGGQYVISAWMEDVGDVHSRTEVPAELYWGVKPTSLPTNLQASASYDITIQWQDIPSYKSSEGKTPINRADVWPLSDTDDQTQRYRVWLDLLNTSSNVVLTTNIVTSRGTLSNTFHVVTPPGTDSNYFWRARLVSENLNDDFIDDFEDRVPGNNHSYYTNDSPLIIWFWGSGDQQWLDQGIGASPVSRGKQSQFFISRSASSWSGNTYRYDLGSARNYSSASVRSNISYLADLCIRDDGGGGTLTADVEMQVEDQSGGKALLMTSYSSAGAYQTFGGTLNQFTPSGINWAQVRYLNINVVHVQRGAVYCNFLDYIRLIGTPEIAGTGGSTNGIYWSNNDTPPGPPTDSDGDGIIDEYETNTGVYVDPQNTGTDPLNPDSDGDGQSDGQEVNVTHTNPCSAADYFGCRDLTQSGAGNGVQITWYAHTNAVYDVYYSTALDPQSPAFDPLAPHTNIIVTHEGVTNVTDGAVGANVQRFYRINVRRNP
jgi:hypothetical protein